MGSDDVVEVRKGSGVLRAGLDWTGPDLIGLVWVMDSLLGERGHA